MPGKKAEEKRKSYICVRQIKQTARTTAQRREIDKTLWQEKQSYLQGNVPCFDNVQYGNKGGNK